MEINSKYKILFFKIRNILIMINALFLFSGCVSNTSTDSLNTNIDSKTNSTVAKRFNNQLKLKKISNPKIQIAARKHVGILKNLDHKRQKIFNYVLGEVEKRNIPAEIALLPLIESSYNPSASSGGRYIGLWQFGAPAAKSFGLSITKNNDERMNIQDSTKAALDYLEYLNRKFDGDWLLSVAAYNAGAGRIEKLILANQKQGLGTDYWSLNVPKVTSEYIPKMIGLSRVLGASTQLNNNNRQNGPDRLVKINGNAGNIKQAIENTSVSNATVTFYNPNLRKKNIDDTISLTLPLSQANILRQEMDSSPTLNLAISPNSDKDKKINISKDYIKD